MILLQIAIGLSFTYVAFLLAGTLKHAIVESHLVKPFAIILCLVTICYHLASSREIIYILAAFVGFFLHTCLDAYKKRKPAPKKSKVNP